MAELIAWDTAGPRSPGGWPLASTAPLTDYERRSLEIDFEELTAQAEELVAAETGLRSLAGPARARVADRAQWVDANVASFQRLLRPVLDKLGEPGSEAGASPPMPAQPDPAGGGHGAGPAAGVDVQPGTRTIRPATHRGGAARGAGHRLLRGSERGGSGAPVRLSALGVPAVAGPPRGDAPDAVHRGALVTPAFPRTGGAHLGRARSRPQGADRGPPAQRRQCPGRS